MINYYEDLTIINMTLYANVGSIYMWNGTNFKEKLIIRSRMPNPTSTFLNNLSYSAIQSTNQIYKDQFQFSRS